MARTNVQPITGLADGDIARHVFLCGDPDRVGKISAGWEDVREVCRVREYVVHTGSFQQVSFTAASTGIGAPSSAILMEELAKLGAGVLLRVGNSGALADAIQLGDFVITTASIRDEGTSRSYVRTDYPAVADYEVVGALVAAARASGHPFRTGITWSIDAFYARNKVMAGDQLGPMSHRGYEQAGMNDMVQDCKRAGVLNVEMESSVILTLASLFGLKAGCICTVSDRTPWPGPGQDSLALDTNMSAMIEVAQRAMLALASR
jgi:uridine phosphorylase